MWPASWNKVVGLFTTASLENESAATDSSVSKGSCQSSILSKNKWNCLLTRGKMSVSNVYFGQPG